MIHCLRPQVRREAGSDRQKRHAFAPAVVILAAEAGDLADDFNPIGAEPSQRQNRFGLYQADFLLEALGEPAQRTRAAFDLARLSRDVDRAVDHFRVECRHIVGPKVECTARAQIEPGFMPVAGDEAVTNRPAVQRESQMWAAVIDRENPAVLPEHGDRPVASRNDDDPFRFKLGK